MSIGKALKTAYERSNRSGALLRIGLVPGSWIDEAFAAAVVFQTTAFYTPTGEGFFALRWLNSGEYI